MKSLYTLFHLLLVMCVYFYCCCFANLFDVYQLINQSAAVANQFLSLNVCPHSLFFSFSRFSHKEQHQQQQQLRVTGLVMRNWQSEVKWNGSE